MTTSLSEQTKALNFKTDEYLRQDFSSLHKDEYFHILANIAKKLQETVKMVENVTQSKVAIYFNSHEDEDRHSEEMKWFWITPTIEIDNHKTKTDSNYFYDIIRTFLDVHKADEETIQALYKLNSFGEFCYHQNYYTLNKVQMNITATDIEITFVAVITETKTETISLS